MSVGVSVCVSRVCICVQEYLYVCVTWGMFICVYECVGKFTNGCLYICAWDIVRVFVGVCKCALIYVCECVWPVLCVCVHVCRILNAWDPTEDMSPQLCLVSLPLSDGTHRGRLPWAWPRVAGPPARHPSHSPLPA